MLRALRAVQGSSRRNIYTTTRQTLYSTSVGVTDQPHHVSQAKVDDDRNLKTSPKPVEQLSSVLSSNREKIESAVLEYVQNKRPTKTVLAARARVLRRLRTAINRRYGSKYSVEQFGSTVYGVDSAASDMDLVLLDHSNSRGFHPDLALKRLPPVYNIWNLARTVKSAGFRNVEAIPAHLPIVKAVDMSDNIAIDLNTNDQLGYYNSLMIKSYAQLFPHLVPMLYFIKHWTKSHSLNSPSLGGLDRSLSSYCYVLMTVGYLQHIGALPNLQHGLRPSDVTENEGFWIKNRKDTQRVLCDTRFSVSPHDDWQCISPTPSLGDVVLGWFRYWGLEHKYENNMVSIRLGGVAPRQQSFTPPKTGRHEGKVNAPKDVSTEASDMPRLFRDLDAPDPLAWRENMLIVADPFIRSKNVSGNVTNRIIERFRAECERTAASLAAGSPLEDTLGPEAKTPR